MKPILRSNSGQSILEYLIVLTVIIVSWQVLVKTLKDKDFFATVFGKPWTRLENVIEFGVPSADRKQAGMYHPSNWKRHSTKTKGSG